ncbi:V-type ATP synthase subunit A [Nodosilinea nodulosa]|uniref:V-type ATP synthase subunit A n=1 Tax=Nodosilinea nodulosa TaxID=416001 RepID=UPI0003120110|nr:V-type ATP synthase subunit A [Nodosilinea nodulosa]
MVNTAIPTESPQLESALARVVEVNANVVTLELEQGNLVKNEVAYLAVGDQSLKAEVIRIQGNRADMQVFEDVKGVRVGDRIVCTGELLSVELGPGLLGRVFDGLQNPLADLAQTHGFFLPRGIYLDALNRDRRWTFTPQVKVGDTVQAGDVLGTVMEGQIPHKIMVPFDQPHRLAVSFIQEGSFRIEEPVVHLQNGSGDSIRLSMLQRWPVKVPLSKDMQDRRLVERQYPSEALVTTIRIIDTFFPLAKGGTACVPGPFGAGKTVLQQLIAKFSEVDVVIIVACGERAGEVVETLTEFPALLDPRSGRPLMERTIIICNTSSMPVAAREASIYTGITLGEYYRQMGLQVLLLADSTSRWAQALREISGRLEEIPGEEAFPAYLDSRIKGMYERAGVLRTRDGSVGSLTILGNVSPAGGNFEEPVTQSTIATVKVFLGLTYNRAYRRAYPAIEPLISWSRYLDQLQDYFRTHLSPEWVEKVKFSLELLKTGDTINQMMQVTGEEGIPLEDYIVYLKAQFLDNAYLQQDAFDDVDASSPQARQVQSFLLVLKVLEAEFKVATKPDAYGLFTKLTSLFKNLNYSVLDSSDYQRYEQELETLLDQNA